MSTVKVKPGKHFCFTFNNPTLPLTFPDDVKYIYQKEKGSKNGTIHYQGYTEFTKTQTLPMLKKLFPTACWSNRTHTREQAYNYCCKERTRIEPPLSNFVLTSNQGHRTDIDTYRNMILEHNTYEEIVQDERLDTCLMKYPTFAQLIHTHRPRKQLEQFTLRPWQEKLVTALLKEPDSRRIYWFYDAKGNQGKSWMTKFLLTNHKALVVTGGKTTDIALQYDNQRIVIFDIARATGTEAVPYNAMESLKNGMITSPKYASVTKCFDIPHVVVFANYLCPEDKFSEDRLKVITLDENTMDGFLTKPKPKPRSPECEFMCEHNHNTQKKTVKLIFHCPYCKMESSLCICETLNTEHVSY